METPELIRRCAIFAAKNAKHNTNCTFHVGDNIDLVTEEVNRDMYGLEQNIHASAGLLPSLEKKGLNCLNCDELDEKMRNIIQIARQELEEVILDISKGLNSTIFGKTEDQQQDNVSIRDKNMAAESGNEMMNLKMDNNETCGEKNHYKTESTISERLYETKKEKKVIACQDEKSGVDTAS